jgi:hypothetical protein
VFEIILPALYSQRASRLFAKSKAKVVAGLDLETGAKKSPRNASARKSVEGFFGHPLYEFEDVWLALRPIVASRMKDMGYQDYAPSEPQTGIRTMGGDDVGGVGGREPPKAPKVKHKKRYETTKMRMRMGATMISGRRWSRLASTWGTRRKIS